jgi:hypothetical protein
MEGLVFFALIAVGIYYYWGRRQLQINRATSALQKIPGIAATFCLVGTSGVTIGLDPVARKIAFVDQAGDSSLYGFKDIVAVEACRNGVSVTKTNRGSQIATAAIGHLLFGEKGFVVGGNTGSTTTTEQVSSLSIKIYLTDVMHPVREIGFYKGPTIETRSRKFRRYSADMDEWYGRIRWAIANP